MNESEAFNFDPVYEFAADQIRTMPDRPHIVVVLVNEKQEADAFILREMKNYPDAYISFRSYKVLDMLSVGFCMMGFESDSEVTFCKFLGSLARLPFDDGAVYVDGEVRMRLLPVPPSGSARHQG